MSQPSLYSPLRSQLREVRVIHLLPSDNFDHDIHCELRAVSLDTNPEYEALSYVWSTPPGTGFITVSGQPMEVTANLLAALRRLRCRQKTRVVWADAICINQADMDERCAQVLLMGDIYRLTKGVLIWLGDGLDGTREDALTVDERDDFPWRDAPMDASFILEPRVPGLLLFGDIADWDYAFLADRHVPHINEDEVLKSRHLEPLELQTPGYAAFAVLYLLSSGIHLPKLPCFGDAGIANKRYESALAALSLLLALPWWTRMWVVQEAILPPKATVILGSVHAPWEMFFRASHAVEAHTGCCITLMSHFGSETTLLVDKLAHNISELGWERERLKKHGSVRETFDLLRQYRCREATDPRDKVYAMLGLAPGLKDVVPDYRRDPSDVCRDAVVSILKESQSLGVLEGPRSPAQITRSWAPDWNDAVDPRQWLHERTRMRQNKFFDVSRGKDLYTRFNPDDRSLALRGVLVDTVSAVSPPVSAYESSGTLVHHIQKWAYMVDLFRNGGLPYGGTGATQHRPGEEARWSAFFRTITRDLEFALDGSIEPRRSRPSDSYVYMARFWLRSDTQKVFREAVGDDPNPSSWLTRGLAYLVSWLPSSLDRDEPPSVEMLNMFWRSVLTSAAARSFFITQEGYYGLGNAQPGDCVFVLYGGTCPFLLRSADQSTTDRFHLVGDCYLHGVMDGEAVERWAPREREVVLV